MINLYDTYICLKTIYMLFETLKLGENPTLFISIFLVIKHTGFMYIERSVSVDTQGFINSENYLQY